MRTWQPSVTNRLYLGEYRIMASSGTTGRRGVNVWNQRDWLDLLGIIMRPTRAMGEVVHEDPTEPTMSSVSFG